MKILLLKILIIVCISIQLNAQGKIDFIMRHIEKSKSISAVSGFNTNGSYLSFGYSYFFKKNFFVDTDIHFEKGTLNLTDYSAYFIKINSNYTIYHYKKNTFINLNGGLMGGSEILNNTKLKKTNSKILYGVYFGINNETYLYKNLCLSLGINQNYILKSNLRSFYINGELGLKYFLK